MTSLIDFSHNAQRAVCLLVAAVIVTASLSLAVFAAQRPQPTDYSVTITQL